MMRAAVLAAALAGVVACTPRPLVDRMIAARGGAVAGLVRDSDVDVAMGFPGAWQWRTVTALPDRYAWSIVTSDVPHHYLFDGSEARAFVGTALVSEDVTASALRTHARFVAVANLDVLRLPGVQVAAVDATTIEAVFPDRGDRYRIRFDDQQRVTSVEGSIDMSPVAKGKLRADYDDFRTVDARQLPHHIHYTIDDQVLADERVRQTCILPNGAPASAFTSPTALPDCPK